MLERSPDKVDLSFGVENKNLVTFEDQSLLQLLSFNLWKLVLGDIILSFISWGWSWLGNILVNLCWYCSFTRFLDFSGFYNIYGNIVFKYFSTKTSSEKVWNLFKITITIINTIVFSKLIQFGFLILLIIVNGRIF